MTSKTCFVIMPIGDQAFGGTKVTEAELRLRYNDLIKEAIQKADPSLEIMRADEVLHAGSITSDVIMRIMYSDIVVADVTYPNPNVFYELGLRHACRVGTVIIRDKNGPNVPFDIMHLRYIGYDNTPTGLKALAEELEKHFEYIDENPEYTDNQFLELAKISGYHFPQYGKDKVTEDDAKVELFTAAMQSPDLLSIFFRKSQGENVDSEMNSELIKLLATQPKLASVVAKGLMTPKSTPGPQEIKKISKGKRQPKKR
jgi:hypothetical protein